MSSAAVLGFVYLLITFLCVGMSGWSTYYGFLSMFKELTLPITLVIGAGLFACDMSILTWRRHGHSLVGILLLLFLFTTFSAASNFNFFYTNYMRDRLAQARLVEAKSSFNVNMSTAETALKSEIQSQRQLRAPRLAQIELALAAMRTEVEDVRKEGWGPKARSHLEEVYTLLGDLKIARHEPPKSKAPAAENNKSLLEIEKRVKTALQAEQNRVDSSLIQLTEALNKIDERRRRQSAAIDALPTTTLLGVETFFKSRLAVIDSMNNDSAGIQQDVQQALTVLGKPAQLPMRKTSIEGIELNTIPSSIQSGFFEPANVPVATGLAALAVLLDLIPLFFALVFVRSVAPASQKREDEQALPTSGEGIVILDKSMRLKKKQGVSESHG